MGSPGPEDLASRMSRYPSAYGHTPSYKSVGGLGSSSSSSYPSALGSSLGSSTASSSLTRDMDREMGAMRREMDKDLGGVLSTGSSLSYSPLGSTSRSGGETSSSYQSKSYSSTSSSLGGGVPHHSSQSDSVYRSTRQSSPLSLVEEYRGFALIGWILCHKDIA